MGNPVGGVAGWVAVGLLLAGGTTAAWADDTADPVARGRYLVEGPGACGNCHTPDGPGATDDSRHLAGGAIMTERAFTAIPPNITQDADTGIGAWTDAQIARAIREGIRPDGTVIGPPMPFEVYRGIADDDLAAMVAYLRTVEPIRNGTAPSEYPFALTAYGPPVDGVAAPPSDDPVAYGAYLAGPIGHCVVCHSAPAATGGPNLETGLGAGGMAFLGPWGMSVAPNLTPATLADWTDEEIETAIRHGIGRDGRALLPPMGYAYYARMTDGDMAAIIAFLRSLPPL